MTTSPYSRDLREKVINYLKKGNEQKTASEIFGIHKNTVHRWWIRYKLEGVCTPKIRGICKK
jgi:transposase